MAISLKDLQRGPNLKPPRILIHGLPGIGKSTFAASSPYAVMIQTEDGQTGFDVARFPLAHTFDEVMDAMRVLAKEDNEFKTLIIESLDWLEPLIWKKTCEVGKKDKIEDFGYSKGYVEALTYWQQFYAGINHLRDQKNMTVIMTAHSAVKSFNSPETDPYDRWEIKLHKAAAALAMEYADVIGFFTVEIMTKKADKGFNNKVTRALGSGQRVMKFGERPSFLAKCRHGYDLPDELYIPKDNPWGTFTEALKGEKKNGAAA